MAVTGAVLSNLDGLVWNKGYLYGTRQSGTTDAIEFGALQRISLNMAIEKSEVRGPESLAPLGVGIREKNLTGTFEQGVTTPEQFVMALGGKMTYDAGTAISTYTEYVNDEPLPFNLHLKSQLTSPDVEIYLYNCVCDNWRIYEGEQRTWNIGQGAFKVYGETGATGRLYTYAKPGNLTTSS